MSRKTRAEKEGPSDSHRAGPLRVLFICSRNRRRSATAERIFSSRTDLEVASAGLAPDAEELVTPEMLEWADLIFVMEKQHRTRLRRAFGHHLRQAKVICLDIPDRYEFMEKTLIGRLKAVVTPLLVRKNRS